MSGTIRNRIGVLAGMIAIPVATIVALIALALFGATFARSSRPQEPPPAHAFPNPIERGAYLVEISGCAHCHSPGGMYGLPDPKRKLAGSDLGWKGAWGLKYPNNLTPDRATGLGLWTEDQIVQAIRSVQRPDHTPIQGAMPWFHYVYFTEDDARAVAKYLRSLPAVVHKVPNSAPPGTKANGAYVEIPPAPEWDASSLR